LAALESSTGYNVALGDRRAGSVKDYLAGLGVGGTTLTTVSYGEEKPVDPGHNEAAWSKNRRAEFVIKQ
jgi:peptidoglycan-associated lipoprotein